jgi:HlyD family secretion protein
MGMEPQPEQRSQAPLSTNPPEDPGSQPFTGNGAEHPSQALSATNSGPDTWSDLLAEPKPRQRRGLRWIIGTGLFIILGVGTWGITSTLGKQSLEPITVSTIILEPEPLEKTIVESGTVRLGGQQTFTAPRDVTVEDVRVQERQRVSAGTVLLILRDRNLQRELQTQLVTNQQGENLLARKQEIVQERQRQLEDALAQLEESQALLERGFISEDEYRGDEDEVDTARSALRDAEVELENQQLTVRNNELITANLRAQLSDTEIVAPFDAVVLNINVNPGNGVQQEGELLTIGDPNQEIVRLQLSTLNAMDVRVNMPVRVSVIGPEAEEFTGRVVAIDPQAIASSEDSSGESVTVTALATLDRPSDGVLIPGSTVSVEIILEQRRSVLTVPLTAVQNDAETPYVWVRTEEGTAAKREVRLGLQNLQSVEILSGLESGDEVVTSIPPDQSLAPGTPLESQSFPEGSPHTSQIESDL